MTGKDPAKPVAGHKRSHSPENMITRSKKGRPTKKVNYYSLHHGTQAWQKDDPKTWFEAMESTECKEWKLAVDEEFRSLQQKGAIKIIDESKLPKGQTLTKCKWVFRKKYYADGTFEKYRARCTFKGFTQRFSIDYKETFTPTPRLDTGRIMLGLSHRYGWFRCQGDAPVAFLNPDLDTELYMELLEGYKKDNKIVLIKKGLYELKKAEALQYDDVKTFLAKLGLSPTNYDVCLYTNREKELYVIIHVDDIQVMGPKLKKVERLMQALLKKLSQARA